MTKLVTVRWHSELDFDATDEAGAIVPLSPEDDAFSPGLLLLAALGGCTGMDAVSIMIKKKVAFDEYRVEVRGEHRESYPRSYTTITVDHVVRGQAIPDQAVARAIELSARKYCMVGATIAAGDTAINHRLLITDDEGERTCDCLTVGPHGQNLSHYEGA